MRKVKLVLSIALFLFFPFSFAAEYTINATDDVYVEQWNADANFGSSSNLNTYNGGSQSQRIFLRYPTSMFSACNPETTTASVSMYYHTQDGGGNRSLRIYEADNDAWREENITWNNNPCDGSIPGVVGGTCNSSYESEVLFSTPNTWKSLGVNAIVKKAVSEGYSNASMIIIDRDENDESGGKQRGMYSKEASSGIYTPYLSVNCTLPDAPTILGYYDEGSSCGAWNTSTSTLCSITDTTPTLHFVTDVLSYCAVGITNVNYTSMGSARNCTGGEGTKEHTCTLIPEDALTQVESTIYISCKSLLGNQNASSTSGPLSVSLSTLEAAERVAIESAIQNSLTGYSLYSNQKIYARDSSNRQAIGIFDIVVKWTSKIWAFNTLNFNDSSAGFFNITPTFYVLEMNGTSTSINETVYQFILATK